ncbi:tigger transposable element-derived protein 4-like [Anopheles bellator]|uniref:tigger transposable element-derived protein 4-like n=1 Tax=Anopheles bellator TaxID=139047 RepID=UPI002648730C|nr:tigger transposable element-derived protein 4-like [Anopheles bellator]
MNNTTTRSIRMLTLGNRIDICNLFDQGELIEDIADAYAIAPQSVIKITKQKKKLHKYLAMGIDLNVLRVRLPNALKKDLTKKKIESQQQVKKAGPVEEESDTTDSHENKSHSERRSRAAKEKLIQDPANPSYAYAAKDVFFADVISVQYGGIDNPLDVLCATNMDGSVKLPLLVVGMNAPRKGCTDTHSMPAVYIVQIMGRMTENIFLRWVKKMDTTFARMQQKVVVFVRESKAVSNTMEIDTKFVDVYFVPANAVSVLKPLTTGISNKLKNRYLYKVRQEQATSNKDMVLEEALLILQDIWMKEVDLPSIRKGYENADFSKYLNTFTVSAALNKHEDEATEDYRIAEELEETDYATTHEYRDDSDEQIEECIETVTVPHEHSSFQLSETFDLPEIIECTEGDEIFVTEYDDCSQEVESISYEYVEEIVENSDGIEYVESTEYGEISPNDECVDMVYDNVTYDMGITKDQHSGHPNVLKNDVRTEAEQTEALPVMSNSNEMETSNLVAVRNVSIHENEPSIATSLDTVWRNLLTTEDVPESLFQRFYELEHFLKSQ